MGKRSELSAESRVEVVLAVLRKEEPMAVLSRRYGVSEQTIYRWRDQFLAAGRESLGKADSKVDESARRLEQMERELGKRAQIIGELSIANDLLKKLSAYPR